MRGAAGLVPPWGLSRDPSWVPSLEGRAGATPEGLGDCVAGAGVGGEGGRWAWRCGKLPPRLPCPARPPPRDYLARAAAMSPGRNVPPQIMLFISLGGSAARQHQAPGGRCAKSPALLLLLLLPSSLRAATNAAPGLGVASAPAPLAGEHWQGRGALGGCLLAGGCAQSQGALARAQGQEALGPGGA